MDWVAKHCNLPSFLGFMLLGTANVYAAGAHATFTEDRQVVAGASLDNVFEFDENGQLNETAIGGASIFAVNDVNGDTLGVTGDGNIVRVIFGEVKRADIHMKHTTNSLFTIAPENIPTQAFFPLQLAVRGSVAPGAQNDDGESWNFRNADGGGKFLSINAANMQENSTVFVGFENGGAEPADPTVNLPRHVNA
ncbi:MAG: hypothetical protein LBN94_02385, partial [Puniceicoccales bacterium]|nr:hypothetical protein [Puniceicoccales bacterium]